MIAGTVVTVVSIPIYSTLYHSIGPAGLAIASDIGILMQTATLAILLDRNRTVPLLGLDYPEVFRSVLAAAISYAALVTLRHFAPTTSRSYELVLLLVAGVLWTGISTLVLKLTGSDLIEQLTARFAKPKTA